MKSSFYSPTGARRGLVIALAAVCLWTGWAVGWLMSPQPKVKAQLEIQNIPASCKTCESKQANFL
jgi:hypothetical protein